MTFIVDGINIFIMLNEPISIIRINVESFIPFMSDMNLLPIGI